MKNYSNQLEKIKTQEGFVAALDQSGGSTPKALKLYGVDNDAWANDEEMFSLVHQMRARIMASPSFTGNQIMGAILFEDTLDRTVEGKETADYLWDTKNVVPFLKVDKGLEDEANGVQMMKPMPELDALLEKAKGKGVFGTKMRSVIKLANKEGIDAIVAQQFAVASQISKAGLMPIIEPEVDITSTEKAQAEELLSAAMIAELDKLGDDQQIMIKLTLPENDNLYKDCVNHAKVLKVVALSGGYSREEANSRLARNNGVIASFSRALSEGLSDKQSETEFDATMASSVENIFQASKT